MSHHLLHDRGVNTLLNQSRAEGMAQIVKMELHAEAFLRAPHHIIGGMVGELSARIV